MIFGIEPEGGAKENQILELNSNGFSEIGKLIWLKWEMEFSSRI